MQYVQTLVLDGLSVTSGLCSDLISDSSLSVRLLSIRDVKNLNQKQLRDALQYACSPSRDVSLRLKGLYFFGPSDNTIHTRSVTYNGDSSTAVVDEFARDSDTMLVAEQSSGDAWWDIKGRQLRRVPDEWASCLLACAGFVAFDALLCCGPRHKNSHVAGKSNIPSNHEPAIAIYSLKGCHICGTAPEGEIRPMSHSASCLPLLAPPPIMASSLHAATAPRSTAGTIIARCAECIKERHCNCCNKWWCESCYHLPSCPSSLQDPSVIVSFRHQTNWIEEEMVSENLTSKPMVVDGLCESCTVRNRPMSQLPGATRRNG